MAGRAFRQRRSDLVQNSVGPRTAAGRAPNLSHWVNVHARRVFARFIPRENERREPPALVVGDPGESLQTVATEWHLRFGLDFGTGYSPGLFLDQRENRRLVRHIAPEATAELLRLHLFVFRVRGM